VACRATVDKAFLGTLGACVRVWAGAVPIPLGLFSCKGGRDEADGQIGIVSGRGGLLRF
jgi:hypothetical protein